MWTARCYNMLRAGNLKNFSQSIWRGKWEEIYKVISTKDSIIIKSLISTARPSLLHGTSCRIRCQVASRTLDGAIADNILRKFLLCFCKTRTCVAIYTMHLKHCCKEHSTVVSNCHCKSQQKVSEEDSTCLIYKFCKTSHVLKILTVLFIHWFGSNIKKDSKIVEQTAGNMNLQYQCYENRIHSSVLLLH